MALGGLLTVKYLLLSTVNSLLPTANYRPPLLLPYINSDLLKEERSVEGFTLAIFNFIIKNHFAVYYLDIEVKVTNIIRVGLFKFGNLQIVGGYHAYAFPFYQLLNNSFRPAIFVHGVCAPQHFIY